MDDNTTVIVAMPQDATWGFSVAHPANRDAVESQDRSLCNLTAAEGVASLVLWHERLGHTCSHYLEIMADKGLARGMMLRQGELGTCDACHVGKQKKRPNRKKLDSGIQVSNQVVFADLLIPSKRNGTQYAAVLVIIDGYPRFVTVHVLTSNGEPPSQIIRYLDRTTSRKVVGGC